jgi:outer membrane protein assembly factor BamD (BamD/ComL family)
MIQLGKAYFYEANDPESAEKTLTRLLKDMGTHPHQAEAAYTLVKLCRQTAQCDPKQYENWLKTNAPGSLYARLLDNSRTTAATAATDTAANRLYAQAYQRYQVNDYTQARQLLDELERQHKSAASGDKVVFLGILINAQLNRQPEALRRSVEEFLANYPESELVPLAKTLLDKLEKK